MSTTRIVFFSKDPNLLTKKNYITHRFCCAKQVANYALCKQNSKLRMSNFINLEKFTSVLEVCKQLFYLFFSCQHCDFADTLLLQRVDKDCQWVEIIHSEIGKSSKMIIVRCRLAFTKTVLFMSKSVSIRHRFCYSCVD